MAVSGPRPGHHALLPGQTPDGKPILAVLLKRTYRLEAYGPAVRAEADRTLLGGDKPFADQMNTTVQFESDFVPYKLATDVVLVGTAHAPGGRTVREFTASLEIDRVKKAVRVIGDRLCKHRPGGDPIFGDPTPMAAMPLRYERAYGGVDVDSHPLCPYACPRNRLGRGFAVTNAKAAIDGLELPNLEDPNDLITPARLCVGKIENWAKQPVPTGFGWYPRYGHPRAGWAGILPGDKPAEQMMRQAYAKILPEPARAAYLANPLPVVDFRYFGGASVGLSLPYLDGDEAIALSNLTAEGNSIFLLPGDRPRISLDIGDGLKVEPVKLQTVLLRTDEGELDLVWRAAFPYPGPDWLGEMKVSNVVVED